MSTATAAPCALVSASQASFASAYPSATAGPLLPASLAYECHISVPVVEEDALNLIDALSAMLQFQSTIDFLDNPPAGYLLAGVNMLQEMSTLRSQVQAGVFESEFYFEANLTRIIAKAHDGHLAFVPDCLSVFSYGTQFGPLVSVSTDGTSVPSIYLRSDILGYVNGTGDPPSAVTAINGIPAAEYTFTTLANNSLVGIAQDPDTIYNNFFYSYNDGTDTGPSGGLFEGVIFGYYGPTTSLTFANGTQTELVNYATTTRNFTGVDDGESFYTAFLNATLKAEAANQTQSAPPTSTTTSPSTSTPAVTQLPNYPSPVSISSDGTLSGYFLEDAGLEDVAVLVLRSMSENAPESFQSTLTDFLDVCRKQNKTNLVIDVSSNPGGNVLLAYDTFKQLFPTIDPYGAGNFRAQQGYEILGSTITNISTTVMQKQPQNTTAFADAGGFSDFASETFLNDSNAPFTSFNDYYGPVEAANGRGNYTNLSRLNIADPTIDLITDSIVVSGYANMSNIAPQPFKSENIIFLSDGNCGSACTILGHFLKWQGKVKSIALGGRPQNGPMQAIGAVKGSEVLTFQTLYQYIEGLYNVADNATLTQAANSSLSTLNDLGEYLMLRSNSAGQDPTEISFNFKNNIAEGDSSYTPLQFVYEAADCRLWYTPKHYHNIVNIWNTASTQAFGLGNIIPWSLCVSGSTNQPSSLSGNATLYNNGVPNNVTTFIPENSNAGGKNKGPAPYTGFGQRLQASTTWSYGAVIAILLLAW